MSLKITKACRQAMVALDKFTPERGLVDAVRVVIDSYLPKPDSCLIVLDEKGSWTASWCCGIHGEIGGKYNIEARNAIWMMLEAGLVTAKQTTAFVNWFDGSDLEMRRESHVAKLREEAKALGYTIAKYRAAKEKS